MNETTRILNELLEYYAGGRLSRQFSTKSNFNHQCDEITISVPCIPHRAPAHVLGSLITCSKAKLRIGHTYSAADHSVPLSGPASSFSSFESR